MRVKSEERRKAILDIAQKLFAKYGVAKTSMSAIAKELGGSKGTLYNYFSSKEEIFTAVMDSVGGAGLSLAFVELSFKKDIKLALYDFAYKYLELILSQELMAIHKMAIAEAGNSTIPQKFYENGPKKEWAKVIKFLDFHIDEGNMKPCNTKIAVLQLKALVEAELLEQYELGVIDKPDKKELLEVSQRAIDSFFMIYGDVK